MKSLIKFFTAAVAALGFFHAGVALASDKGTAPEATALVKKAADYMKANGKEKAFAAFNDPKGAFIDRDLYIFVFDMNGKTLAHGTNPKLLDKNMSELRDADGKYFIKEFLQVAGTKGSGWIDYKWTNPVTKAIEPKSTYIEKHGDVLIGCGIYK